jgi:HD-GYP domain-containing protein (c-di-GMP phosphodiesterase class II)
LPVDGSSIVGKAAMTGRPINIPDLAALSRGSEGDLSHNRSFDTRTGYQARSMLTVPLLSAPGEVIGVIQLINKKRWPRRKLKNTTDFEKQVVPFEGLSVELAMALASQAGVSLENAILYEEIRRLFEGFVDAAVTAIEARDPTTSGHSRRVATLSVALAEKVDAIGEGPLAPVRFSREDLRQIEYAGVLHDFGKVGVRENVLVKAKKLYAWQRDAIAMRLRYVRSAREVEALREKLALHARGEFLPAMVERIERELHVRQDEIDEVWRLVAEANEPALLGKPAQARLAEVATWTYRDEAGIEHPVLMPEELTALQVERGTLTSEERTQIQSHVDHTIAFLRTIPWGRSLCKVPRIAGGHHELLDGSGYPRGLAGEAIPVETRMLTIADIFDALTAADRPYKAAVPVERALDILSSEVKNGRCDAELFRVFVAAAVWKKVVPA